MPDLFFFLPKQKTIQPTPFHSEDFLDDGILHDFRVKNNMSTLDTDSLEEVSDKEITNLTGII